MICVSVGESRRCVIRIYIFLMVEMFYSFESCFTLFDLPLYSFTSVGVNRSVKGKYYFGLHLVAYRIISFKLSIMVDYTNLNSFLTILNDLDLNLRSDGYKKARTYAIILL